MKKIGNLLFGFILFLFLPQIVKAEINVKIELTPQQVGVGDQIQLTYIIQADEDFEVEAEPHFPDTDGLSLIDAVNSGKSSSSRMNITNGQTQFSKTVAQQYDYVLQVTKAGVLNIPALTAQINGKNFTTAGFTLRVSPKALNKNQAPHGQDPRRGAQRHLNPFDEDEEDDIFSQLLQQRKQLLEEAQKQLGGFGQGGGFGQMGQDPQEIPNLKLDVNTNESFFITADTDKKEAYEGEQITVNWYIYVKGMIESLDRAKFPDLKGFWKEIIEEVPGLQFTPAIVNGIQYKRAMLASHALFPIKAGTAVIDEFKIKAKVRNLTSMGWGQPHEYTKSSRRIPIKVLPLPLEGRPKSFSGAVGQFQIQAQVDSTKVTAGQPFSLKVRFEGQGNAKLIDLPPIEWPENLEVFDTKSDSKFFKNGQSYKEFEVLLTPTRDGEVKIPQIYFSYFDPATKKYETKSTMELTITAEKADPNSVAAAPAVSSGDKTQKAAVPVQPILELPSSFSWAAIKFKLIFSFFAILVVGLLTQFGIQYSKIRSGPKFASVIRAKFLKMDADVKSNHAKAVGIGGVSLIYSLLRAFNSNQAESEENITKMVDSLPSDLKTKHGEKILNLFDYFQTLGFAPESVIQSILDKKDLRSEYAELKKISDDFVKRISESNET